MQSFASKCIRNIVIGPNENNDIDARNRKSNREIRKENRVATTFSQKLRDMLCDIYRWKTSLSPAYLNNINKCELHINRWVEMWKRMKNILSKIENEEILDYNENEIYEMYKDLVKPEFWEEAKKN